MVINCSNSSVCEGGRHERATHNGSGLWVTPGQGEKERSYNKEQFVHKGCYSIRSVQDAFSPGKKLFILWVGFFRLNLSMYKLNTTASCFLKEKPYLCLFLVYRLYYLGEKILSCPSNPIQQRVKMSIILRMISHC